MVYKCPKCGADMKVDANGVYRCTNPKCNGVFIPGNCPGVFIPASIIGIH